MTAHIGTVLAKLRKESNCSLKSVSGTLRTKYHITLPPQTILEYEQGRLLPDTNTFLAICAIYNCSDILYSFGYSNKNNTLSSLNPEELQIIANYRALPSAEKDMILGALGIKKDRLLPRILSLSGKEILLPWIFRESSTLGHHVLKQFSYL